MNASSAAGATAPQPASATSGTPEPQHEQEAGAVEPAATSASTTVSAVLVTSDCTSPTVR